MESNQLIGYVGAYTKGDGEGIYAFTLDTKAQKITDVHLAAKLDNPTYLTITKDNHFLYSVVQEGQAGGVAAFTINPENGQLNEINRETTEGTPPCHVSINSEQTNVFTAYYHKGQAESRLVNQADGSVLPALSVIQHTGSGPDERQEKAHTHFASVTPDEKYIAVAELGIDQIFTYEVKDGVLAQKNSLSVAPGSGPRHLTFHPNGKFAYCMTEFSSEVIVLAYDSADGRFTTIQTISTLPEDFKENNQGSAIHISADGRYLYAGNRGHNSIAVFQVNSENGEVEYVDRTSTEGDWPRDFVLDPTEKFLIASNQNSSNLVLFSRDEKDGTLTLLQSDITVPDPTCVKFLNV